MTIEHAQNIRIREIDPASATEISLVASRMRQTLEEVLGEERGRALYSMEWLLERVRWHLDPVKTVAKIFLAENQRGAIIAQAIARLERDPDGDPYGYFSTLFVEPGSRRQGLASRLVQHVETWFKEMKMPRVIYNTAENHQRLIALFGRHGYEITHCENEMVQLTKCFGGQR